MSVQLVQWGLCFVPWLSLFFMRKRDIKRFMPVALFNIVTSIAVTELAAALQWIVVTQTAFPLQTLPFHFGVFPVLTIWVMRFTFRKFWLYLAVEFFINIGFAFLFYGWLLPQMGILHFEKLSRYAAVLTTTAHALILYVYQLWQDGAMVKPEKS
jgi:hypothetical protein